MPDSRSAQPGLQPGTPSLALAPLDAGPAIATNPAVLPLQPTPGAALSECELPDQNVGGADRLVAVIADILFFCNDSHVVSLIPVGPRSRSPRP